VQARAVIRPGEGDAAVIVPIRGCPVGLAVTVDGNPWYGLLDPKGAGALAVVEAARNLAAVGAEPIGMTDCLNYGNPEDPEVFHQFAAGVRGIREGAEGIGLRGRPDEAIPVVSGNVSFYNQSTRERTVAPSPIICMLGRIADASHATTIGLEEEGDLLLLVGERRDDLGGSLFYRELLGVSGVRAPRIAYAEERGAIHFVGRVAGEGRLRAAHDIAAGGALVALAEMVDGARCGALGADISVDPIDGPLGAAEKLFSESGGFLLETDREEAGRIVREAAEERFPIAVIGSVVSGGRLTIRHRGAMIVDLSRGAIAKARRETLAAIFTGV